MQSGCNVVGRVVWFVVQIGLCSVGGQQPIPRDVQTSVTGVWSSRELTSLPGNGRLPNTAVTRGDRIVRQREQRFGISQSRWDVNMHTMGWAWHVSEHWLHPATVGMFDP